MKIYMAGKITGDPNYKEQLAQANLDIGFRSGFQAATGNSAIGYMPGSFSPFATI